MAGQDVNFFGRCRERVIDTYVQQRRGEGSSLEHSDLMTTAAEWQDISIFGLEQASIDVTYTTW